MRVSIAERIPPGPVSALHVYAGESAVFFGVPLFLTSRTVRTGVGSTDAHERAVRAAASISKAPAGRTASGPIPDSGVHEKSCLGILLTARRRLPSASAYYAHLSEIEGDPSFEEGWVYVL